MEVSGSTENSTILPLSYEDFNVNGFGYSNYVDLYGAGNGYEDVERISIIRKLLVNLDYLFRSSYMSV